jgi:hypothetical protein
MAEFEWDQAKAAANLEKHAIDFEDAIGIFDGATIELCSDRGSEERWKAVGILGDLLIVVVYTRREARRRILLARKAKRNERKAYRAAYPEQPEER